MGFPACPLTSDVGAILFGRQQIGLASGQIRNASENYRLSELRMTQGVEGTTPGDVALSIRSLEQAHFNYLTAFPLARSVSPVPGGVNGHVPQTFIETGERSWA